MIDASSTRGEIPFTNDYWGFSYQEPRKQNAEFAEIVVDKWPHIFLISTCQIQVSTAPSFQNHILFDTFSFPVAKSGRKNRLLA